MAARTTAKIDNRKINIFWLNMKRNVQLSTSNAQPGIPRIGSTLPARRVRAPSHAQFGAPAKLLAETPVDLSTGKMLR